MRNNGDKSCFWAVGYSIDLSYMLHFLFLFYRCGYDQIPGPSFHPLDGVLGLGKGKSSILSQLHSQGVMKNVVGHCISGRGGGFLFFGDDLYDSSRVAWTPMLRDQQ